MKKKDRLTFKETFSILVRALKVSVKTKTKMSLVISGVGFGMAFLPILIARTLERFTNEIQELYGMGTIHARSAVHVFILLSSFYIIQAVYNFIKRYYARIDSLRIYRYIKKHIIEISCRVRYKYMDNFDDFAEKVSFAKAYAGIEVANSIQSVIAVLQNLITFASIFYVLVNINYIIVIALVVVSLPSMYFSYKYKDEEYRGKTKWRKEGWLTIDYFLEACRPETLNEVRFFRLFPYIKGKWRKMADEFIKIKNGYTKKHVLSNSIADLLRNSVYIIILLITAKKIFNDPLLGLGTFMLVFTLSGQMIKITTSILVDSANFIGKINYMKDFFELDNLERENTTGSKEHYMEPVIRYEDVRFTYPNSDIPALNGINVEIGYGEKIAVVGYNGSGKTTFVNLLCGMYEPQTGTVSINGTDVNADLTKTRNTLSVVFQDFVRYEASIRYNISVSEIEKSADDDELGKIAGMTGVSDFINAQEHGYDEIVGSFSEKGNNLSGGQWQKVALARAAFRDKADVMILDEPTAALDPIAESELYENFTRLTGDRTTILISHRLGITSIVDRVLVFHEGRIIEDGSHDVLMRDKGHYYEMYNAQAQWYKSEGGC